MDNGQKFNIRPTTPEELESTLVELDEGVQTAFNVDDVQAQFNQLVGTLNQKRTEMQGTIKKLELTKNTLKQELRKRSAEEAKVNYVVSELEQEKESIESTIRENKEKSVKLAAEKEKLSVLMGSLKTAIEEMRAKVKEL